jgi:hypothetical protein
MLNAKCFFPMILYPLNPPARPGSRSPVSVWDPILRTQKQPATEWWLIAQPDHAALAGDLAAHIASADFPRLDQDVLQAIALHDEGWAEFDSAPKLSGTNRPLSFLELQPREYLRAWRGSIERAEQVGPIGGLLVSGHFSRLAQSFLQSSTGAAEALPVIQEFLGGESERQGQLFPRQHRPAEAVRVLVDVLQFCDLLSLYLCCGADDSVEFPQRFGGNPIRLRREKELFCVEPHLFGSGVSLAVRAHRYPAPQMAASIPFLLA